MTNKTFSFCRLLAHPFAKTDAIQKVQSEWFNAKVQAFLLNERNTEAFFENEPGYFESIPTTKFYPELELNYQLSGNGKHYILLIPDAFGSWRGTWEEQFEAFDKDQFTLIAIDPLGYGRSKGVRKFDVEMFAKDAIAANALMQELRYTPYTVLGWGDGGITALHMAANADILQSMRKMIIYAAQAYVTSPDIERIKDKRKLKRSEHSKDLQMYGDKFTRMWYDRCDLFIHKYGNDQSGDIIMNPLRRIRLPTLVVHGDNDTLAVSHAYFLQDGIKHSELVIVDGGHNIHQTASETFNRVTQEFLRKEDGENDA